MHRSLRARVHTHTHTHTHNRSIICATAQYKQCFVLSNLDSRIRCASFISPCSFHPAHSLAHCDKFCLIYNIKSHPCAFNRRQQKANIDPEEEEYMGGDFCLFVLLALMSCLIFKCNNVCVLFHYFHRCPGISVSV